MRRTPPAGKKQPAMPNEAVSAAANPHAMTTVGLAAAAAFTLAQGIAYVRAFAELNINPPSRDGILSWMTNQYGAGLAALLLVLWAGGWNRRNLLGLGAGAVVGWLMGATMATGLLGSLGPGGQFAWMNRFYVLAALLTIGVGVAAYAMARRARAWAPPAAAGAVGFHVVTYLALSSIFLANLGPLEEEARRVSPAPAWGLVAALSALAVAVYARRARDAPGRIA